MVLHKLVPASSQAITSSHKNILGPKIEVWPSYLWELAIACDEAGTGLLGAHCGGLSDRVGDIDEQMLQRKTPRQVVA